MAHFTYNNLPKVNSISPSIKYKLNPFDIYCPMAVWKDYTKGLLPSLVSRVTHSSSLSELRVLSMFF